MMIAAKVARGKLTLAIVRTAEFASPHHQGVVQHASPLQIVYQGGRRLVGFTALRFDTARQVAMLIPALMIKLNESHPALGQPPS